MDGSFFAFALVGALVGYIVGDFQRELRFRREARANLALANSRTGTGLNPDSHDHDHDGTGTGSHGNRNFDGPAHYINEQRREARRRAIRGDNGWTRPNPSPVGRYLRSTDETPVVLAGRGWEFDGD